jgi:proteasome lid subunit RPN8/RPN11
MLYLTSEQRRQIEAHGEQGYPDEICGFLIGTSRGEEKTVVRVTPIENDWGALEDAEPEFVGESRRRRFYISPDAYDKAEREVRQEGLGIIGFYHSHPDHLALPSSHDLAQAQKIFPGYSYIIVAVHGRKAVDMTSWVLRDDYSQFDSEVIDWPPIKREASSRA